jgi:hypothetical protein
MFPQRAVIKPVFIFVFSLALLLFFSSLACAGKNGYVAGLCLNTNSGMDSQYKVVFSNVIKAFAEKEGEKIEIKIYNNSGAFISDINKNLLDFAVATDDYVDYPILKQNKITPFLTFTLFGQQQMTRKRLSKNTGLCSSR